MDVDELARARPALAARLLEGIADRLRTGVLRPLPATEFAAAEVEAAFRGLQASRHIGKLVIAPPAVSAGEARACAPRPGRGAAPSWWSAASRASASPPPAGWPARGPGTSPCCPAAAPATPGAEAALRDLAALGATATIHACDATDAEALAAALQAIRAAAPPLRGVVHAAAVAGDGAAARLDPAAPPGCWRPS